MEKLFRFPSQAYTYIHYHYGFIGLLVSALAIIMFFLSLYFWYDRRRA